MNSDLELFIFLVSWTMDLMVTYWKEGKNPDGLLSSDCNAKRLNEEDHFFDVNADCDEHK